MKENKNIPGFCQKIEKTVEHDGSNTNCRWCTWNGPQRHRKETGGTGDQKKSRDYPDNNNVKICKKYLKRSCRLAITQTSVKKYSLKLMRKISILGVGVLEVLRFTQR